MRIDRSEENVSRIRDMAVRMRKMALDMALSAGAKGAHIGGGFSAMEIMAVLYGEVLRIDPNDPLKAERDRLLISKNHCTIAHFPALVEKGFIKEDELSSYAVDGSRLIGYPYLPEIGIEYSGGSLGMAISVGVGQALAAKKKNIDYNVYVLMGDGELNEGSIWEAFMSANQFGLGNLIIIIDRNHLCYDGTTEEVMQLGDLTAKMESFGFNTIGCRGHDISDLLRAFDSLSADVPNAVICDTVKGKGLSFAENRPEWHQKAITKEQYDIALTDLMGGKVI
ncbi:MAG: transketolase [Lachnospiraceae bacterium]|nr:transketolase [Lachnospiraceae bacterium]